jgi:hypothetical protein
MCHSERSEESGEAGYKIIANLANGVTTPPQTLRFAQGDD